MLKLLVIIENLVAITVNILETCDDTWTQKKQRSLVSYKKQNKKTNAQVLTSEFFLLLDWMPYQSKKAQFVLNISKILMKELRPYNVSPKNKYQDITTVTLQVKFCYDS